MHKAGYLPVPAGHSPMVLITALVWEDLRISCRQVVCLTTQRAKEVFGIQTGRCGGLLQWAVAPPGSFPAFFFFL